MRIRQLFHRHYPALVRFLHTRVGDPEVAADLAQEAFLRLLAHRPRRPRPWLFAVAANLARDASADDRRRARRLELLRAERAGDTAPPPDEWLARKQSAELARRWLRALSERDRTLLVLRHEGFSYREIAEVVGVSPTSVGPLLARAQRRLRRAAERDGEDRSASASA